jgi:vacuolar-type H+-ATPase subunit H
MPKKPVIDREQKESLVPTISREEDRLKSYLDDAAAEARRIVQEAEQEAAGRTRGALDELPAVMEQRRAQLLRSSRERAEALRAELAAETEKLLKKAEANCQAAASLVVAEVWPGGA